MRRRVGQAALLLVLAGAAAAVGGCGGPKSGSSDAVALYTQSCLSCHGDKLQGKVGPSTDLRKVGSSLTREQIAAQIANGGEHMPAFGQSLSEAEIGILADWLAAKK